MGGVGAFTTTPREVSIAFVSGLLQNRDQCQRIMGWRKLAPGPALMGTWWLPSNPLVDQVSRNWVSCLYPRKSPRGSGQVGGCTKVDGCAQGAACSLPLGIKEGGVRVKQGDWDRLGSGCGGACPPILGQRSSWWSLLLEASAQQQRQERAG